jgi:prepilin-type processing-associated H-X9-DG protein
MYQEARAHADSHAGQFPDAPELMAHYADNPSLWAITKEEEFTWHPGRTLSIMGPGMPMPPYEPVETYPNRLMAHEQQMKASGMDLFGTTTELFRIENKALDIVATVTPGGRIDLAIGEGRQTSTMEVDAQRATCQNNLKQLGLVIRMFENEHHGYSPPGWHTVYPEYLTDVSVLTSPKDPPGTDSYQYLLPATHMEEYARQFQDDPENPAARAMTMSRIPIMLNRTDWTVPVPGRNVLFMDGHVEWMRTGTAEWRERIVPFLR